MMTVNQAHGIVTALQASTNGQNGRPHTTELEAELARLNQLDQQQLEAWLDTQLAVTDKDASLIWTLLTDWRDYLQLQHDPKKDTIKPCPELDRWLEIGKRWGWACWTGRGLPPQLIVGHDKFMTCYDQDGPGQA